MSYPITYANSRLQALCERSLAARRQLGEAGARKLHRRVKELQISANYLELRQGPGDWHPITHDWPGCVGGELGGAATIIVRPTVDDAGGPGWHVECIGNCYKH